MTGEDPVPRLLGRMWQFQGLEILEQLRPTKLLRYLRSHFWNKPTQDLTSTIRNNIVMIEIQ